MKHLYYLKCENKLSVLKFASLILGICELYDIIQKISLVGFYLKLLANLN